MPKRTIFTLTTCLLVCAPVSASKLNPFVTKGPPIGVGSVLTGLRGQTFTVGSNAKTDLTRGGTLFTMSRRKEAWTLKETDFATIAFKSNGAGRIVWISAFVRPGKEVEFTKLGDPAKATSFSTSQAIWNVGNARGGYRLVAKGMEGRANVVYLLSLDFPEVK